VSDASHRQKQLGNTFADIVDWDAEAYSNRIPNAHSDNKEDSLCKRYLPRLFKVKGPETLAAIGREEFGKPFTTDRSAPVDRLTEPAIILDIFGRILLWYLPGVLSAQCQQGIWSSCGCLQDMFHQSIPRPLAPKPGKTVNLSWRKSNFVWPSANMESSPGSVILSPGWFMQGNDVRLWLRSFSIPNIAFRCQQIN
jgi:hypothetical protein